MQRTSKTILKRLFLIVFIALPGNSSASELKIATASFQGGRKTMEDVHAVEKHADNDNIIACGVFDGHGTRKCADFVAEHLFPTVLAHKKLESAPKTAITSCNLKVNNVFLSSQDASWRRAIYNVYPGTTAINTYFFYNKLLVANVGDSRAVLCSNGRALPLSVDQKVSRSDEKERIINGGGLIFIDKHGHKRVNGILAISRAFGNKNIAKHVQPVPEFMEHNLTLDDEFLVLASDGIWDVINNQEAVDIAKQHDDVKDAAYALVKAAHDKGSRDNLTAMVIGLKEHIERINKESKQTINMLRQLQLFLNSSGDTNTLNNNLHGVTELAHRQLNHQTSNRFFKVLQTVFMQLEKYDDLQQVMQLFKVAHQKRWYFDVDQQRQIGRMCSVVHDLM